MESTGEPGRVQVTRAVVEALHPRYRFSHAGVRQVKGKGEVEAFWLEGRA
jgi:class 3 adenylate cyclase